MAKCMPHLSGRTKRNMTRAIERITESGKKRVSVAGIKRVPVTGIKRVRVTGIERVGVTGKSRKQRRLAWNQSQRRRIRGCVVRDTGRGAQGERSRHHNCRVGLLL